MGVVSDADHINGLYVMKKIVTMTMTPARVPTLPIRWPERFELRAERVARLQVALGQRFRLAHLGLEEPMLEPEEGDDREEADDDEGVARLPGPVARREQPDASEQQDHHPGVDQVLSTFCTPARIAGVAAGYCGATEKKNA